MINHNLNISIFIINETDLMLIDNLIKTFGGANLKAHTPIICFAGCEDVMS